MNPNDAKKKLKRKSEFRFHSVTIKVKKGKRKINKHPAYVFFQNGNLYIYVQLTHSKRIKGKVLIKMKKNPNPSDNRDSYYIEEVYEDDKSRFGKKKNKWVIDEKDEKKIREYKEKSSN